MVTLSRSSFASLLTHKKLVCYLSFSFLILSFQSYYTYGSTGSTNVTGETDFKSYQDERLAIRIQHPAAWEPRHFQPLFDVLFVPPTETEHIPQAGFGIKVIRLPPEIISDIVTESVYASAVMLAPGLLKNIIPDFTFRGSDREAIGEIPARSIRFFGYIGEGHKAVQLTFLINDDRVYVLSYFTQKNHFMENFQLVKRMINSFEIISS
jgi:hypothetical protein